MRDDHILDVCIPFNVLELTRETDHVRTIAEVSHHHAAEKAAEAGGHLRHPDPREVDTKTAVDPLTGEDVLLVTTRWIVDGTLRGVG